MKCDGATEPFSRSILIQVEQIQNWSLRPPFEAEEIWARGKGVLEKEGVPRSNWEGQEGRSFGHDRNRSLRRLSNESPLAWLSWPFPRASRRSLSRNHQVFLDR